ncbi:hypothetical protein [Myxococcus sp. AS-1-15]|uniref:phosphorylase family protein n=1 Tax=Myxococcus sp. AS-1-15 TaxID=2874600 RepID=UPI001CBDF2AE|nr:hypothetical protein [Myxococcus sp. AS-1-15]MBZ4402480.1 hypothetical protein [Myxococcus sp. AS-1-15]BDT35554.1 response regulator [Myxococcus sp. MH1]
MRILIIHDRPDVGAELQRIANEAAGAGSKVDLVQDVWSARDRLKAGFHDLVAIDLTLPIKAGNANVSLANTQLLLEEIFEGEEVKAPSDVIGISKDPEVLDVLRTSIGQHLMGCLHEDAEGTWREAFKAKVSYVMRARTARRLVTNSSHDVDLILLTALDKEAKPYADIFELSPSDDLDGAKDFSFTDAFGRMRRGLLYSIGQAGQPPCASVTQVLLTQFRPKLIVLTGFCGGVAKRTAIGDLVAFRSASAWDYGKWEEVDGPNGTETVFRPRPMPLNCPGNGISKTIRRMTEGGYNPTPHTLAAVTKQSEGRIANWKVHERGAGSGSAVVTSLKTLSQITDRDEEIWAIDMESYAFYYACLNTPVLTPDFICLKSVADHCNGEKNSIYHAVCSTISARFAHEVVTHHYNFGV